MPAERTEPNAKPEDGAASPAEAGAQKAPGGGGFAAWLPLLVVVTVMPLLAYAMNQFVLLPQLRKGLGITALAREAAPSKSTKENSGGKKETLPMNKLLVNVAGTMGGRYLLVSVSLSGSDPEFKAKITAHDPQLRDLACGVLAVKTLADLEKPGVRNVIRSELISGFNNILGGAVVQEIYLTEFAIQ